MSLEQRLQDYLSELTLIDDPQERLAWITDRGKRAPGLPEADKNENNLVKGCVSKVWVHGYRDGDLLRLGSDGDSPMVKGLVHAVVSAYDGALVSEIANDSHDLLLEAGIAANLTPTRRNGLAAVRRRITELARGG